MIDLLTRVQDQLPEPSGTHIRIDHELTLTLPSCAELICTLAGGSCQLGDSQVALKYEATKEKAIQELKARVITEYWDVLEQMNSVEQLGGRKDWDTQMTLKLVLERFYSETAQDILQVILPVASKSPDQVSAAMFLS